MRILNNVTGVSEAECLPITKSAGTLIFNSTAEFTDLNSEKITIMIAKKGSSDIYICRDMPLQQFIDLTLLVNNDLLVGAIDSDSKTLAYLDLGLEAGILLGVDESIKISFKGLVSGKVYGLSYNEQQENTLSHINFEQKSVNLGESEKTFDVQGFEAVTFPFNTSISQIGLFAKGKEYLLTPWELRVHTLNDRPSIGLGVDELNDIRYIPNYFTIDLLGFDALKIYKAPDDAMQLYFVNHKEMLPAQSETAVRFGTSALASSVSAKAMNVKTSTNLLRR